MGGGHGRDRQGVSVPLTELCSSRAAGQISRALFILLSVDEWPEQYNPAQDSLLIAIRGRGWSGSSPLSR